MNNLPLEILTIAREFVADLLPTFKEVSEEYYINQYGPCPYLDNYIYPLYPYDL